MRLSDYLWKVVEYQRQELRGEDLCLKLDALRVPQGSLLSDPRHVPSPGVTAFPSAKEDNVLYAPGVSSQFMKLRIFRKRNLFWFHCSQSFFSVGPFSLFSGFLFLKLMLQEALCFFPLGSGVRLPGFESWSLFLAQAHDLAFLPSNVCIVASGLFSHLILPQDLCACCTNTVKYSPELLAGSHFILRATL